MSTSPEPMRFITVAEMLLFVNEETYSVARTGGGKIELRTPAEIPPGQATFVIKTFSDDGELLNVTRQTLEIVSTIDDRPGAFLVNYIAPPVEITEAELAMVENL